MKEYIVIYCDDNGLRSCHFTKDELDEFFIEFGKDTKPEFLDKLPFDPNDVWYGRILVIKGKIVMPKPIEIVKSYSVE